MDKGVRYEIDLYIEIDQGFGYKAIFLFECKNWEDNVSTAEIVKFSDKIKVTNAQKGFFIAKSYTASAEAKAKQDDRINLLYVDDSPIDLTSFLQFNFVNKINKIISIEILGFGVTDLQAAKKQIIDFENCVVKYKGQEGKFSDFITVLIEEMAREKMDNEKIDSLPEGKYSYESEKEFTFQKEELFLKDGSFDKDIEKIKAKVVFDMELIRPKIISKIDILTRGRYIEYESVKTSNGGEVKFAITTINFPLVS
jgi:hypothetical protein